MVGFVKGQVVPEWVALKSMPSILVWRVRGSARVGADVVRDVRARWYALALCVRALAVSVRVCVVMAQ